MRHSAVLVLCAMLAVTAACDSTDYRIDPLLTTDTVEIAVPRPQNDSLPTALDVTALGGVINGGRFPEESDDAEQWDFGLRERGGQLVLIPAGALGQQARSAITRAIPNRTFESLIEAPGRTSFVTDSAVVLQEGSVYAARSRLTTSLYGTACEQYAKLLPLRVDRALGRVRLMITTNERCGDPRLALED